MAATPLALATSAVARTKHLRQLALIVLVAALLGVIDYFTGTEISFSVFYLIPVYRAVALLGPVAGASVSLLCATIWLGNEAWWVPQHFSQAWIPYWNAAIRLLFFLVVTYLVTQWKAARQAASVAYLALDQLRHEQLLVKDQLLSQVSHELRTPLAATHQFVSLVRDGIPGAVNEEQREYLEVAQRNIQQLTRMIDDLLDSARAEAGKLVIDVNHQRVDEIAQDVVRIMRSPAAERGIALNTESEGNVPLVLVDPSRIRQVVTNLVDNAVKFTPSGGSVVVRIARQDADFVRVSVQDTGKGISKEAQGKLFSRLFQVEDGSGGSRRGLGLGLFLCREIVTRHGGRIWIESDEGKGSTFHFTVPVHRSAA